MRCGAVRCGAGHFQRGAQSLTARQEGCARPHGCVHGLALCGASPVKDDERFPCLQKQRGGPLGTRARNRTREEGCMGRGRNRRRDGDATCIIRIPDSTASCKLTARAASSRMVRTADHARVCLPRPTGVRGGSHPQHKCTFASLRTRFGSYCPLVPLTHVMLCRWGWRGILGWRSAGLPSTWDR